MIVSWPLQKDYLILDMIAFVALLYYKSLHRVMLSRNVSFNKLKYQSKLHQFVSMKLSRIGSVVTNSAIKTISLVQFNTLTDNKTTLWFLHYRCYLLKCCKWSVECVLTEQKLEVDSLQCLINLIFNFWINTNLRNMICNRKLLTVIRYKYLFKVKVYIFVAH